MFYCMFYFTCDRSVSSQQQADAPRYLHFVRRYCDHTFVCWLVRSFVHYARCDFSKSKSDFHEI